MGLAGAAGAVSRLVVDHHVRARTDGAFPWGTWVVNVVGALLLGVVVGASRRGDGVAGWELVAASGFCGAFTTFSTWMVETVGLLEQGAWRAALGHLASLVPGVVAVAVGLWLAGA